MFGLKNNSAVCFHQLKPDGLKQANKVSPDKPTCTSVKRGATLLRSLTDQRSDGPPAWSLCLPFMTTALAKVAECKNATLMVRHPNPWFGGLGA